MKGFISCLVFYSFLALTGGGVAAAQIDFVEFKNAEIKDAAKILSSMTGANIAVTKEASDNQITLLLQNTELKHAVDMISRVAGLWYRYSKAGNSYIIMTEQQYQDDIVVYKDDIIRTFTLRHQNVNTTAVTIQSLFGERVRLKLHKENDDFDGLEIEEADDATTIKEDSDSNRDSDAFEKEDFDSADVDEGKRFQEETLSSGSLRALGDSQSLAKDKANRLAGVETPIFIATNRIHNLLFVRTSDENALSEIAELIKRSDRPTPQVLLEMKIVRIDVGESYSQDFEFSFNDKSTATGVKGTNFGFNSDDGGFYEFFSNYVSARIELLEKNNQAEVVAKPIVLASNNRPARLFIGEEQVIPVSLDVDTTFSAADQNGDRTSTTTTTLETERRKVGNTLILLPSVNADRTVTIDILQDTSTIEKDGLNFPFYNNATNQIETVALDSVQEANVRTIVVAKDGHTIALGGMINREDSNKDTVVPLLGDVPLLGEMFRTKEEVEADSQYVMLITPHVLMSPDESADKSREVAEIQYDAHANVNDVDQSPVQQYQLADYVELTRYAAKVGRGDKDVVRPNGLVDVPMTTSPLSFVFDNPALSVWPIGGWQKRGLYVSLLKVRNHSNTEQSLDLSSVPGGWLAAAGSRNMLMPFGGWGDGAALYLLSDRPFSQIISTYNHQRVK